MGYWIKGQEYDLLDLFAPLIVLAIFATVVFLISVTLLNYVYVSKYDDLTKLEEWGYFHVKRSSILDKLGPHSPSQISLEVHQKDHLRASVSARSMGELERCTKV